jgi:glycosyltransferase involved in cell wall biosynthesis
VRVALLAHTVSGNALMRTYSLWLLIEELGWDARIHVPTTRPIWPGLPEKTDFRACFTDSVDEAVSRADVLVAVKPQVNSLGVALRAQQQTNKPVVLDVDEADWEERYGLGLRATITRLFARAARGRPRTRELILRTHRGSVATTTISNPSLSRWYNGVVIPHVSRERHGDYDSARHNGITVAFIGTPRRHKGIPLLREAVRRVPAARLVVTADPPPDADEHEQWLGATTNEESLRLMDASDVVAIPSLDTIKARYQLPYKLIDAMHAGRAIVASDLPPIRWAMDEAGVLVLPGCVDALASALQEMKDPALRQKLGHKAQARARDQFTPRAVAPNLARVLMGVVR